MNLWVIRILFLSLCTTAGYAISQVRPELVGTGHTGILPDRGTAGAGLPERDGWMSR